LWLISLVAELILEYQRDAPNLEIWNLVILEVRTYEVNYVDNLYQNHIHVRYSIVPAVYIPFYEFTVSIEASIDFQPASIQLIDADTRKRNRKPTAD